MTDTTFAEQRAHVSLLRLMALVKLPDSLEGMALRYAISCIGRLAELEADIAAGRLVRVNYKGQRPFPQAAPEEA